MDNEQYKAIVLAARQRKSAESFKFRVVYQALFNPDSERHIKALVVENKKHPRIISKEWERSEIEVCIPLLVAAPDLQAALIAADDRIAELEAALAAAHNPPYRIVTEMDCDFYRAVVMRCDVEVMAFDWYETEDDARAEAQQFIDKLTAPFGAKGE